MTDERRIVIVGGSAAGLKCACRLKRRRPSWEVTVVEKRKVFSYGACGLPYVLSGDIDSLAELRETTYGVERDESFFEDVKGVTVLSEREAVDADLAERTLTVVGPDGSEELKWDELVLATGAHARMLPGVSPSDMVRTFHTWDDVAPLKQALARGELEHVAVIGAGPVGCELAEAFVSLWGAEVTLIEAGPNPLPNLLDQEAGAIVQHAMESKDVTVLCGHGVERITETDEGVEILVGKHTVSADAAIVAIGVTPSVDLAAKMGLHLGDRGGIVVNDQLATSEKHVWAAGDCIEVQHIVSGGRLHLPLGSLANRQGRTLADAIVDGSGHFGPVAGAFAVKVFDVNVATVGCTVSQARGLGRPVAVTWTTGHSEAHYWPEASRIHLQLVFDEVTRELLGVQAVGAGEVAKRVDVATQVLLRLGTIDDLAEVEHAYAPPYAPAMDPIVVAAHVAGNLLDGLACESPLTPLESRTVIDVRTAEEREAHPLSAGDVVEIDLETLSSRTATLPPGPLLVACAYGTRSSEAARALGDCGIEATYLAGGVGWLVDAGRL